MIPTDAPIMTLESDCVDSGGETGLFEGVKVEGLYVGATVEGALVGREDTVNVGEADGTEGADVLGDPDGLYVGSVGLKVGAPEGLEGITEGKIVGLVGVIDGLWVGVVGTIVINGKI